MIDYKRAIELFQKKVNLELSKKTDPYLITFTADRYNKGVFNGEDLAEVKGYFNGLKVALKMLDSAIDESECVR